MMDGYVVCSFALLRLADGHLVVQTDSFIFFLITYDDLGLTRRVSPVVVYIPLFFPSFALSISLFFLSIHFYTHAMQPCNQHLRSDSSLLFYHAPFFLSYTPPLIFSCIHTHTNSQSFFFFQFSEFFSAHACMHTLLVHFFLVFPNRLSLPAHPSVPPSQFLS